ncbi:MAG: hypothetical protein AB2A00_21465 [Myxococcota bacterium]
MKKQINSLMMAAAAFLGACGETGNPQDTNPPATTSGECTNGVCVLSGALVQDLTLTADKKWLLRGGVFVGNDVDPTVLTIEPGTQIYGESSTNGMLVVTRGSKIMAQGTREKPIVFTSSKSEGARARGDWGGVIINGRAPVNGCSAGTDLCEAFGEGGTGYYGGTNPDDNSGVIQYVRVEFAGRLISPDNELNGIAFQGVGRGTVVDYVQIHMAKDDCIEFFGGTVDAKHIVCTGIADDNLDWTDGWNGRLQFMIAQQYEDAGDNGIEGDNNAEDNASSPRSHPVISNVTLLGSPNSDQSDIGVLLREGTAANISNIIVSGFNEACLDIDHTETFTHGINNNTLTGNLTLDHSIFHCVTPFIEDADEPVTVATFFNDLNDANSVEDPVLVAPDNLVQPNFAPESGSPARLNVAIPNDPFFTQVTFRGGMDPADDWTTGWTVSMRN